MARKTRKATRYRRRKGKSLISSGDIKPQEWGISDAEALEALQSIGEPAQRIKKIKQLKHQISISFVDNNGNSCSSFYSYRIFTKWEREVEKLIYRCKKLTDWLFLNLNLKYEFSYYGYPYEMIDYLQFVLENHFYVLKAAARQEQQAL
jgi:hypothetical protein